MLNVRFSAQFKKDYKAIKKRKYNNALLEDTIDLIWNGTPLPEEYSDHPLKGNYINHRECHIAPDWLLIYKIENDILVLTLTRTGTHSDLF